VNVRYFKSAERFRSWLSAQASKATEILIGFYNHTSGKAGMTYREALDEALCFGWIDGVRRSIDGERYSVRFTPRKPRSVWSRKNVCRATVLKALGRMTTAGLQAFEKLHPKRSGIYSFENRPHPLAPSFEVEFKTKSLAWVFFQARPPWYRKTASWWVMSARKEETRRKRLDTLIADSSANRLIKPLTRPVKKPT
jgi:uncharacterized protein YdeI (YjbR/CyaY-like superfamily)